MADLQPIKRLNRLTDLTGERFGTWTVIEFAGVTSYGKVLWRCLCDCGKEKLVTSNNLTRGKTTNYGCLKRERFTKIITKHGLLYAQQREYKAWSNAKSRCFNINHPRYPDWGGRGITMCDEWRDSFESFFEYMGPCPEGYSIDRIDNDGPYAPGNTRWATIDQQNNNQRTRKDRTS